MTTSLELTKKGTPRKRRPKQPRIYFNQDTEDAIIRYLATSDEFTRNKIYNQYIEYSFYKLVENIIHTFKFYHTDNDTVEELKHEVITFLLEKLPLYNQAKGKAYSYFGTIAKRYLINYNNKNYAKLQEKATTEEAEDHHTHLNEATREENYYPIGTTNISEYMDMYIKYVEVNLGQLFPKDMDAKTANAVLDIFRQRENLEILENKKALYIYIREMISVDTPQITKIVKKLKILYTSLYNQYYDQGYINM